VPSVTALWWEPMDAERRLLHDRRQHREPGAAFAQVNQGVAQEMHTHVVEQVLRHSPATVVDAYAGSGDTAVAIAEAGVRVAAIELDADAAGWCAKRLPAGSEARAGFVEDLLPRALPADVVILNPPRGGVDVRVSETLERTSSRPRAIVYVSCNPATLARDLTRLPSYTVESLNAFDMFPQTAHVETVCVLVPNAERQA
jgi:23S rRNA (uracil1939-C5)-methyltransferase